MTATARGINPHANPPISLKSLLVSLWDHRGLIFQATKREVLGRYKGSVLGLAWSFFNPVMMLMVYTFVFSVVFKARWGGAAPEGKTAYAVILFAGLIIQNFFAEVLNRSPGLILANTNYVKRVVFPLEILSVVTVGAALFHCMVSFCVLLIAFTVLHGHPHWTIIFVPVVVVPFMLLVIGISWMLASLGVFLRDLGQTIMILTTVLMFFAPVFYDVTALPVALRPWLYLNPVTFVIEQMRAVVIWGHLPDWRGLVYYTLVALVVMILGYMWFQKTRKGFADVL